MKEQVIKGINNWVSFKIDEIAEDNILLTLTSGVLKNGAKNIVSSWDMGMILPFITKGGVVDAHFATDEIVKSLNAITPKEVKIKGIPMTIGGGYIKINLPDSLGDLIGVNVLSFKETDINDLANRINNEI